MVMVLRFLAEDYARTNIDQIVTVQKPFILVNAVKGPKFDPKTMVLQSLDKIVPSIQKAIYVVGFAEDVADGVDYDVRYIEAMAAALGNETLRGRDVGVHFLAENMQNTMGVQQYGKLMACNNWKYILVSTKHIGTVWEDPQHIRNFKYNLRELGRVAYVRGLLYKISPNEEFDGPTTVNPPATTVSKSTATPMTEANGTAYPVFPFLNLRELAPTSTTRRKVKVFRNTNPPTKPSPSSARTEAAVTVVGVSALVLGLSLP